MKTKEKPTVKLIGTNGSAFALMGKVSNALKKSGMKKEADEYFKEATSGNYNHLLQVTMKYVNVT